MNQLNVVSRVSKLFLILKNFSNRSKKSNNPTLTVRERPKWKIQLHLHYNLRFVYFSILRIRVPKPFSPYMNFNL